MTEPLIDAFVAVGSNIEPEENIRRALLDLKKYLTITAISNLYKTPAVNRPDQPDFLNGVVKIQTNYSPRELKFDILRKIEEQLGRFRSTDKFAARTIDLDLIVYGDLVIDEPDLCLPDPSIRSYPFVAIPLLELAPELILPDTLTPLSAEPAAKLNADLYLETEFTARLRRLILP
jgi:2-amino-4-hydroxy-6-hydroxymethyldihydropteridine diphosphokinase